jgi:hypothetical protein
MGWSPIRPPPVGTNSIAENIQNYNFEFCIGLLATTNSEHLGAAAATYTLGRRFAIFHRDSLGIFHFFLGTTFNTICFHFFSSHFLWLRSSRSAPVLFELFTYPRNYFRLTPLSVISRALPQRSHFRLEGLASAQPK